MLSSGDSGPSQGDTRTVRENRTRQGHLKGSVLVPQRFRVQDFASGVFLYEFSRGFHTKGSLRNSLSLRVQTQSHVHRGTHIECLTACRVKELFL